MKQPQQFYRFAKNEAGNSELYIEGVIASESWYDDEVTPKAFREELAKHSGEITVRINSPGGDVFAGMQIYNMLKDRDGGVIVIVDALAASAASFIAMAGDKIIMNTGSMMMVHKASTIAWGNEDEMLQIVEMLRKTDDNIVSVYAARTGKSAEEIKQLLADETWMTADEAVEMGFADEATAGKTKLSNAVKNALGFTQAVQNAALQPVMSIKNKLKNESKADDPIEAEEVKVDEEVEPETPEEVVTEPAETPTEGEKPVEETPPEEVTEPPVEEIKDKTVVKEPKAMTKTAEEIAKEQVTPSNQAPVTPKADPTAYLKSKQALVDFANVLKDTAGKSSEVVRDAWKANLVKNGLTDPDYFTLPEPVITRILDAVKASGIYNVVTKTGLDVFKAVWDDADEDADTSRAGGHNKGDTKDEQVLDFDDRVLRAKYIYKYLTLDKETIRENQSTGALIRFVLNELPVRIIREIERAIVIGDGRASNNKRHITSFISIKSDVVADNAFATSYEPVPGDSRYATVLKAMDLLEAEGQVYLVSKKGYLTDLKLEQGVNGGFLWAPGTSPLDALGIDGEFRPKWFKDATDPDFDAYLVVFEAYYTVGDDSVEAFTNFKLETNEEEFLQELYAGGGLVVPASAVGIAKSGS